jgi:hypothetical protein
MKLNGQKKVSLPNNAYQFQTIQYIEYDCQYDTSITMVLLQYDTYCEQSQVKQHCCFNQFIMINDKSAKYLCEMKTGKTYWGIGQVREREKQREQIRREREVALVERRNGVG